MILRDELRAGRVVCKLCSFLATLPLDRREEWERELNESVSIVGHTAVVNALKRRGVDLTEVSVRRHRGRHGRR